MPHTTEKFDRDSDVNAIGEKFKRDGYALIADVVDDQIVAEALDHTELMREWYPDVATEDLGWVQDKNTTDPFWANLVSNTDILGLLEPVLGTNIVHHHSAYFLKQPHTGEGTKWHQDGHAWDDLIEPRNEVVTVWVAFTDSTPENGCLRVIPGTHESEYADTKDSSDSEDEDAYVGDMDIDKSKAVDFILQPGDVSLHHPTMFHSSYDNTSDRWRRAIAIRYTSNETKFLSETPNALLVRGDPGQYQTYNEWPKFDENNPDHMHFDGWQKYNRRADEMNKRIRAHNKIE